MRFGITIGSKGPQLNSQAILDMKEIGLTDLRFQYPWAEIEKTKGVYNWTIWDDAVAKCNAATIRLCLTIKEPPAFWKDTFGLPIPQGVSALAQALAARYNGASGHGTVEIVECGNEDYSKTSVFYAAPLAAAMRATYQPVKNINPDLIVLPGAWLQRNTSKIKAAVDTFWREAKNHFDGINFHFYTGIPDGAPTFPQDGSVSNIPNFPQYYRAIQEVNAAHGFPDFPVWCTEFGFPVTANFGRQPRTIVDEQTQWEHLKYCYDQARELGIVAMYLFTLGYASPAPDGMSLRQAGGSKTIAYQQLSTYIAAQTGGEDPDPDPDPTGPTLEEIALARAKIAELEAQLSGFSQALTLLSEIKSLLS